MLLLWMFIKSRTKFLESIKQECAGAEKNKLIRYFFAEQAHHWAFKRFLTTTATRAPAQLTS